MFDHHFSNFVREQKSQNYEKSTNFRKKIQKRRNRLLSKQDNNLIHFLIHQVENSKIARIILFFNWVVFGRGGGGDSANRFSEQLVRSSKWIIWKKAKKMLKLWNFLKNYAMKIVFHYLVHRVENSKIAQIFCFSIGWGGRRCFSEPTYREISTKFD